MAPQKSSWRPWIVCGGTGFEVFTADPRGVVPLVQERREAMQAAAQYPVGGGLTDLASIPPFMRWFTNTYGAHTLAAILHDALIVKNPTRAL